MRGLLNLSLRGLRTAALFLFPKVTMSSPAALIVPPPLLVKYQKLPLSSFNYFHQIFWGISAKRSQHSHPTTTTWETNKKAPDESICVLQPLPSFLILKTLKSPVHHAVCIRPSVPVWFLGPLSLPLVPSPLLWTLDRLPGYGLGSSLLVPASWLMVSSRCLLLADLPSLSSVPVPTSGY